MPSHKDQRCYLGPTPEAVRRQRCSQKILRSHQKWSERNASFLQGRDHGGERLVMHTQSLHAQTGEPEYDPIITGFGENEHFQVSILFHHTSPMSLHSLPLLRIMSPHTAQQKAWWLMWVSNQAILSASVIQYRPIVKWSVLEKNFVNINILRYLLVWICYTSVVNVHCSSWAFVAPVLRERRTSKLYLFTVIHRIKIELRSSLGIVFQPTVKLPDLLDSPVEVKFETSRWMHM